MDTAEGRRQAAGSPVTILYDGFMSYSHAADDLLAPRFQAGLQRFAKPWWKRRALRIFRDEASLTANPHLWASITDALDESRWFILLLSPEAAASEWVNREVEYWLEHKDADRIIPVLTEGDFSWAEGDIVSAAVPPALHGVFSDEPRWVDMRFARSDEQLDLQNPAFSAAVADVASAIHGVPKDELESEEVRQHRRTVRTAWAGGLALLLLTVLAGATAIYANDQRVGLAAQRDLAIENEELAVSAAAQLIDFVDQMDVSDVPDREVVPEGDLRSRQFRSAPPGSARLDFLEEGCELDEPDTYTLGCVRDARFVHPEQAVRSGPWNAYAPFHIRHGFVASDPAGVAASVAFAVEVFVRRDEGPRLTSGEFRLDRWHKYLPDYVVRETTDRCGPGYRDQTEAVDCDLFVHDFPDGLPPGRYSIFVEWRAPCSHWFGAGACDQPARAVSLFNSFVSSPFFHEDFNDGDLDVWPRGLWDDAEPIP